MWALPKPRKAVHEPFVEWRANHIADPVERLRYLRQATVHPAPSVRAGFQRFGGWRLVISAVLWMSLLIPAYTPTRAKAPARARPADPVPVASFPAPQVWPVDRNSSFELFSNGLRIENEFAVTNKPRVPYPVFRMPSSAFAPVAAGPAEWRSDPAGIVFHSTESMQAPFELSEVSSLRRLGRGLLEYVQSRRSYHFVIDRFGRVYRVVAEADIAFHAGKSVWSDARGTYVSLNNSFLSIAFEAQTGGTLPLSPAQIHAAKVLTDMLRSKYNIAATNCVTHAQVSVNPSNMRIGYHTDWASGFPFYELGLPDNYAQVVPSMALFGFRYDGVFSAAARRPWTGLLETERLITEQAGEAGVPRSQYQQRLQERYRKISAELRSNEETQDESYQ